MDLLLPGTVFPVPADKVQQNGWPQGMKQQSKQGAIVTWHYWLSHR